MLLSLGTIIPNIVASENHPLTSPWQTDGDTVRQEPEHSNSESNPGHVLREGPRARHPEGEVPPPHPPRTMKLSYAEPNAYYSRKPSGGICLPLTANANVIRKFGLYVLLIPNISRRKYLSLFLSTVQS